MPPTSETYRAVRAPVRASDKSKIRKNFLGQDRETALHWRAFGSVAVLAVLILAAWMWLANAKPGEGTSQSVVVDLSIVEK